MTVVVVVKESERVGLEGEHGGGGGLRVRG